MAGELEVGVFSLGECEDPCRTTSENLVCFPTVTRFAMLLVLPFAFWALEAESDLN